MKKLFIAALLVAGLMLPGIAASAAEVSVDFVMLYTFVFGDSDDPPAQQYADALAADYDANGMGDLAEAMLLERYLEDDSLPNQAVIIGAYQTNYEALAPLMALFGLFIEEPELTYYRVFLTSMLTLGSPEKNAVVLAFLQEEAGEDYAEVVANSWNTSVAPNLTLAAGPYLLSNADPDGDTIPNLAEYTMAAGDPAVYVTNALTPGEIDLTVSASGPAFVDAGSSITLTASVSGGTAPYEFQWSKDGTTLSGKTSEALQLLNVTAADSGEYTCLVTDAEDSAMVTNAVVIDVLPAGSVPVAGFAGLGLLAALVAGLGARKALKK